MAQDPERDDEQPDAGGAFDPSHDLDMTPLFFSQTIDSEVEAEVIRGVLEANGIPSTVGGLELPPLGLLISVPRNRLEDARRVIAEQRAAGPEAAAEAEAASEE